MSESSHHTGRVGPAHRITGLLAFFYQNPFVNLMEIGLAEAVLFHGLNGLRIIAIDFRAKGPHYQREMLWAIVAIWIVVMVPGAFFMLQHSFEVMFGSK